MSIRVQEVLTIPVTLSAMSPASSSLSPRPSSSTRSWSRSRSRSLSWSRGHCPGPGPGDLFPRARFHPCWVRYWWETGELGRGKERHGDPIHGAAHHHHRQERDGHSSWNQQQLLLGKCRIRMNVCMYEWKQVRTCTCWWSRLGWGAVPVSLMVSPLPSVWRWHIATVCMYG